MGEARTQCDEWVDLLGSKGRQEMMVCGAWNESESASEWSGSKGYVGTREIDKEKVKMVMKCVGIPAALYGGEIWGLR